MKRAHETCIQAPISGDYFSGDNQFNLQPTVPLLTDQNPLEFLKKSTGKRIDLWI